MGKHMGYKELRKNESGMAAIVVTVVLMMVITLITLGFSQVIRREQRNTLDHQLATQAYYAAESGVNLAVKKIKSLAGSGPIPAKNNCDTAYPGAASGFTASDFNIGSGVDVTCLLIQPLVPTLEYQKVDMHAVPMLVKAESGNIQTIHIGWQKSGVPDTTGCSGSIPGGNSFGPTNGSAPTNWPCTQPLVRIDLVALPNNGSLTRDDLLEKQYTSFLYPITNAAGSIVYSAGFMNNIKAVRCASGTTPRSCITDIDVSAVPTTFAGYGQSYALRIMSIYGSSDVSIWADGATGTVNLVEQQIMVDVTAKAQDVLRRIQVRTSVSGSAPDFGALAGNGGSDGICKRYAISADKVLDPTATYPACAIP